MMNTQITQCWERLTSRRLSTGHEALLAPLQPAGKKNAIFLVPGGFEAAPDLIVKDAQFFLYIQLIHALGRDRPVYGLRRIGLGGISRPYRSVEQLAVRYADTVLSLQPHGPHLLVGHCIGGIFAYEIARQLSLRSSKVSLVLLDTFFPNGSYKQLLLTKGKAKMEERVHDAALRSVVRRNLRHLFSARANMNEQILFIIKKICAFAKYRLSHEYRVWQNSHKERMMILELIADYRLRPYAGELSLLVTDDVYRSGLEKAWEELAVNGLEIHRIPGDHATCLHESVQIISDIIREVARANETSSRMAHIASA
jgi:thioesterase domain-containing protein